MPLGFLCDSLFFWDIQTSCTRTLQRDETQLSVWCGPNWRAPEWVEERKVMILEASGPTTSTSAIDMYTVYQEAST